MTKSIKKILSVILCAVILLSMGAISISAASYANPVFDVTVLSESSTSIKISLNLVSGKFNCADFVFSAPAGYTCKKIENGSALNAFTSAGGFALAQNNPANGAVSIACTTLYSNKGSFFVATYNKPSSASYKPGDVKIKFSNCSVFEKGDTVTLSPKVSYAFDLSLNQTDVAMNFKDSMKLELLTAVSKDQTVVWESSDTDVITVDEDGNVYAAGKGNAKVTCSVVDAKGNVVATAECNFKVDYTAIQWIIIILLFGFLWYI